MTVERRTSSRERRARLIWGANVESRFRVAAIAKAERGILPVATRAPLARSRLPGVFPPSSLRVRDLDTDVGNPVRSIHRSISNGTAQGCGYRSSRKEVLSSFTNASIWAENWRITSSMRLVGQLPTLSQIILGGAPRRKLRCRKSESFETITKSCWLAKFQTASSSARSRLKSRMCAACAKTSASRFMSV